MSGLAKFQHPLNIIHINILVIAAVISVFVELDVIVNALVTVSALQKSALFYTSMLVGREHERVRLVDLCRLG